MGPGVTCIICPSGTACEGGATLDKLPVVRGAFRINGESIDVRKCPDAAANCSTTFGTSKCQSSSGCVGGTDAAASCALGLTGTFCRTCLPHPEALAVYYLAASDNGEARCEECGNTLTNSALFLLLATLLAVVAGFLFAKARRKEGFQKVNAIYKPQNKLKILIGKRPPPPPLLPSSVLPFLLFHRCLSLHPLLRRAFLLHRIDL